MRVNCRKALAAWKAGKAKRAADSVWTDGESIYSYATCIVTRDADGTPIVNRTRYSTTTSQHQTALHGALGVDTPYVDGLPRGCDREDLRAAPRLSWPPARESKLLAAAERLAAKRRAS